MASLAQKHTFSVLPVGDGWRYSCTNAKRIQVHYVFNAVFAE